MEVLYWQFAVAGSTAVAYIFVSRIVGLSTAILWSLWTVAMLDHGALIIIQIISAWGMFFSIDAFTRQSRQIQQFKESLEGYQADDKLALIQAQKDGKITPLTDSDHYSYMLGEIKKAESSILILSGWLSDRVVDQRFVDAISGALLRGVQVFIGFGWEDYKGSHELSNPAKRALGSLLDLKSKQSGLNIGKFNNHQKLLIVDKHHVVCGSHNWLSNRSFKNRERSFIIKDQEAAETVFNNSADLVRQHAVSSL